MRRCLFISLLFLLALPAFSAGQSENPDTAYLSAGAEEYGSGNLQGAADLFKKAAASTDTGISSIGYYNYGTLQSELAGAEPDPAKKRQILEDAYAALNRSAGIGGLPEEQERQARRNMEVVREKLSMLPDEHGGEQGEEGEGEAQAQENKNDGQSGESSGEQGAPQQDGAQNGSSQQSADSQQSTSPRSPEDMLQQQRELSSRTRNGEGDNNNLADEQHQLQKESEAAEQNKAALNQSRAAEALRQGDREKAAEYQAAAERALEEAAGEEQSGEAEEILNREAENAAERNRLDSRGGVNDAERNW